MKRITDTAYVVSIHDDQPSGTLRLNLKWQGDHDILAFDLDRLGKVMNCRTETQHTGWVIVEPYNRLGTHPEELFPAAKLVILQTSLSISAGDSVPLKERSIAASKSRIDWACFFHCVTVCTRERRLLAMLQCFAEELAKCCHGSDTRVQNG